MKSLASLIQLCVVHEFQKTPIGRHLPFQGRIQDFRFSGVDETKWHAKRAAILAMPIFAPEKWYFLPFSGLYTPYTEYSTRRKY